MQKTFLMVIVTFLILSVSASAGNKISMQQFDIKGYEINAKTFQKEGDLYIQGRISYGQYCDRLKMKFKLKNENGKKKTLTTIVKDVGGSGTRTIRDSKTISKKKHIDIEVPDWEIVDVSISCQD